MKKRLLLISSSRFNGGEYLEHCDDLLKTFLGKFKKKEQIVFVPYAYAEKNWDSYTKDVQKTFNEFGYNIKSVHEVNFPHQLIADKNTKAIFVGGGNTFRLLNGLYDNEIIDVIKRRVNSGEIKYIGTSAGSNVACPTIKTTNDMPIVWPQSLTALNLVNFQINPHFISGKIASGHMQETREDRIREYFQENDIPVVGLPEICSILIEGDECAAYGNSFEGNSRSIIFQKNKKDRILTSGEVFYANKEFV